MRLAFLFSFHFGNGLRVPVHDHEAKAIASNVPDFQWFHGGSILFQASGGDGVRDRRLLWRRQLLDVPVGGFGRCADEIV